MKQWWRHNWTVVVVLLVGLALIVLLVPYHKEIELPFHLMDIP
jgi:PDZ domain-containing secreted protein